MSTSSTDFETLLERLRMGDEEAAWELVCEYGPHVLAVVRRKLTRQLRVRVDSQDVAQAVWKSFFFDIANMTDVRSPAELINLLIGVTHNKVATAYRRHLYTANRAVAQERPLVVEDGQVVLDEGLEIRSLSAGGGTPSQFAMARERWRQMVAEASPTEQEILRRRLKGESYEAIGESLGISARSAKRCLVDLWQAY